MTMLGRVIENDTETITIPNPVNFTGAVDIGGLTASRAVVSNSTGVLISATTTSVEIGYVNGVTSAIQTQLNAKSPIASPTFTGTVTSPAVILSSETASTIASFDASKNIKSLATATYPSLTELAYMKGVTSAIQTQMDTKSPVASPTFTGTVTSPAAILSSETASTIASFDASKNIKSLATATYPSLEELAYVKGVTSAVQTQMDTKAPLAAPVFTGLVKLPFQELTASGAITSNVLGLNHATVAIAATLAAPVAGEPLFVVDTSASGTAAHTVRLTAGTFDGTNNTATLNAPDEALYCIGVSATRFQIILNVGAVGLSST